LGVCQICGSFAPGTKNLCETHSLTLFQILEGLDEFMRSNPPPEWLMAGLQEIGWIYQQNPMTAGYFNTAEEVVETFVIDQIVEINVDDLEEINYTSHPTERILVLLENSLILERSGDRLRPGKLTRRLQETRLEGYEMDTPAIKKKIKEMHGIITLALAKSLLKERSFTPRKVIAILDLLSQHMLASPPHEIVSRVPSARIDLALHTMTSRQQNRARRIMAGFNPDGETKILADVNDNGDMILKQSMLPYLTEMRERFRTRERELERSS